MWKSYHIYNFEYFDFLKILACLLDKFKETNLKMFYTIYADMKGIHYRLRVNEDTKEIKKIEADLVDYFGSNNLEERIYDPEIIKYGENLDKYELFSVKTTNHVLETMKKNLDMQTLLNEILGMIRDMLEVFDVYDEAQIRKSIDFWKHSRLYYRSKISKENMEANKKKGGYIKKVVDEIEFNSESERRSLCFNFIHLTLNRFNFNIKDECYLYYKLLESFM